MIRVGNRVVIQVADKYDTSDNGSVCNIKEVSKGGMYKVDIPTKYNAYYNYELIKVVKNTKLARKMYESMIYSIEGDWIHLKGEHEQNI